MDDTSTQTSTSTSVSSDPSREKLMENVQSLADSAEELLRATTAISNEGVALARRNLTESLRAVRMQLGRIQTLAVQSARQAAQATDSYVRRHPWQAVGIAVAIGFVASLLGGLSRRSASRQA